MHLFMKSFIDLAFRLLKIYQKYKGHNNDYAAKFFLCEHINLMNVIFQIFCTNKFVGGISLTMDLGSWNMYKILIKPCQTPWMMSSQK